MANIYEEQRCLDEFNTKYADITKTYERVARELNKLKDPGSEKYFSDIMDWYAIWNELDNERRVILDELDIRYIDIDMGPFLKFMRDKEKVRKLDKLVSDFELAEKQLKDIFSKKY